MTESHSSFLRGWHVLLLRQGVCLAQEICVEVDIKNELLHWLDVNFEFLVPAAPSFEKLGYLLITTHFFAGSSAKTFGVSVSLIE